MLLPSRFAAWIPFTNSLDANGNPDSLWYRKKQDSIFLLKFLDSLFLKTFQDLWYEDDLRFVACRL